MQAVIWINPHIFNWKERLMATRTALLAGFLVAGVTLAGQALAQQDSKPGDECFRLEAHEKQRECLETRARKSAQAVADAGAKLLADLNNWDQDTMYVFQTSSDLAATTKAYEQYKSAQCELHASLAAGGGSSVDRHLMCEIALNEQRSADLRQIDLELEYWKKN
jgi:hypothetical protein